LWEQASKQARQSHKFIDVDLDDSDANPKESGAISMIQISQRKFNSMGTNWENCTDPSADSVSVIIPVYNGAKFIAETLESILGQTVPPAEVIVVNDGSTDNTVSVVEKFGDSVILINVKNGGACKARNIAAASAKGNWIAPCDGDDLWLPTKLEKQLRLAHECPDIQCVITDFTDITGSVVSQRNHLSYTPKDFWVKEPHGDGFVVREPITGKLTTFQPSIASVPIVKRDFYHNVGGFDETPLGAADDTCFHFRCLSVVPFGVVPEVLMHYRRHAGGLSADGLKQLRNTVHVWNHIIAEYPLAQPYRAELLDGLVTMRKEIADTERYQRRQKIKRYLRLG
jgi:glycosyltransferase involved in cell wall biosynthesis